MLDSFEHFAIQPTQGRPGPHWLHGLASAGTGSGTTRCTIATVGADDGTPVFWRSLGVSILTSLYSVIDIFGVEPFHVPRANRRLAVWFKAKMVDQPNLHRALHDPLRELAEQAALPGDLLTRAGTDHQLIVKHVRRQRFDPIRKWVRVLGDVAL